MTAYVNNIFIIIDLNCKSFTSTTVNLTERQKKNPEKLLCFFTHTHHEPSCTIIL